MNILAFTMFFAAIGLAWFGMEIEVRQSLPDKSRAPTVLYYLSGILGMASVLLIGAVSGLGA